MNVALAVGLIKALGGNGGSGSGSNVEVVKITYDDINDRYVADQTFSDVASAIASGKLVLGVLNTSVFLFTTEDVYETASDITEIFGYGLSGTEGSGSDIGSMTLLSCFWEADNPESVSVNEYSHSF